MLVKPITYCYVKRSVSAPPKVQSVAQETERLMHDAASRKLV